LSASISQLIPELQPFARDLLSAAGAAGLQPRITSTRRSSTEQARLYRRYQQGLNPYPVAPPGTSAHEYGYAFDMVVSPMDASADVGAYWKAQGGIWGGEFNDPIHYEYPGFSKPAAPFQPNLYDKTLNFLASFLPIVGEAQMVAWIGTFVFPDLEKSELYDMIQNPLLHLEQWAAVQRQWIG
jgi:hypothetical protein